MRGISILYPTSQNIPLLDTNLDAVYTFSSLVWLHLQTRHAFLFSSKDSKIELTRQLILFAPENYEYKLNTQQTIETYFKFKC